MGLAVEPENSGDPPDHHAQEQGQRTIENVDEILQQVFPWTGLRTAMLKKHVCCRSAAFANMGLAVEPDNSGPPLITMLKGQHTIENADEVLQQVLP